uniref:Uncharacterized protein n=1 Tax=Acrobeloides nanus TaxID=290746 RepID=A0A914CUI3_9BILA
MIQEVRNILYSNPRIWHPFDEKTYQIASVFVNHVEQANIGISVWGFTIVTKPLILTTISLIITYLTLVMELQMSPEKSYDAEMFQNYTEHLYKNITETFRQYVNFTL